MAGGIGWVPKRVKNAPPKRPHSPGKPAQTAPKPVDTRKAGEGSPRPGRPLRPPPHRVPGGGGARVHPTTGLRTRSVCGKTVRTPVELA